MYKTDNTAVNVTKSQFIKLKSTKLVNTVEILNKPV